MGKMLIILWWCWDLQIMLGCVKEDTLIREEPMILRKLLLLLSMLVWICVFLLYEWDVFISIINPLLCREGYIHILLWDLILQTWHWLHLAFHVSDIKCSVHIILSNVKWSPT